MRFGDLTYLEIRKFVESGCLAVVPTGCIEQQGPHLPVDWDSWFAETLCVAAADRLKELSGLDALVLPVLPFGPTPEHRGYGSGYIDIPQPVHQRMVTSVLNPLADQGFQRIVVWQGCGGHRLRGVVDDFNRSRRGAAVAFLPEAPFQRIWQEIGDPVVAGGHADSFTTSIALYLRPESVRKDQIRDPNSEPVDWSDPNLDFTKYSTTGVVGDPTQSGPELGKTLWEACVEAAAEIFIECATGR